MWVWLWESVSYTMQCGNYLSSWLTSLRAMLRGQDPLKPSLTGTVGSHRLHAPEITARLSWVPWVQAAQAYSCLGAASFDCWCTLELSRKGEWVRENFDSREQSRGGSWGGKFYPSFCLASCPWKVRWEGGWWALYTGKVCSVPVEMKCSLAQDSICPT